MLLHLQLICVAAEVAQAIEQLLTQLLPPGLCLLELLLNERVADVIVRFVEEVLAVSHLHSLLHFVLLALRVTPPLAPTSAPYRLPL